MRKIVLEPVDNGIIRTILDDNIDGIGTKFEEKKIFILNDSIDNTEHFINSLISDLGLYTGNPNDKSILQLEKRYSENYNLTNEERLMERKALTVKLNKLKVKTE